MSAPGLGLADGTDAWVQPAREPAHDQPAGIVRDLTWEQLVAEARRLGRDDRFTALSDDEVVEALSVGAAQIDAAVCRWLELLAEFVVRGSWADQGAKTPGAWLSWRLGVGSSTAREHVRVALRLREFPRVRERFAAGTLSYSKVRALTRFGDPALEAMLLDWADDATAAQLESVARGFRTAERAKLDAAIAGEVDTEWSFRGRSYADGSRTLTVRGPVEVIAAIEEQVERLADATVADRSAAHPLDAAGSERTDPAGAPPVEPEDPRGAADDLGGELPTYQVTAVDRVEALASVVAVAAAGAPPDTSGLDRHTLVLHASVDDIAQAVDHAPDEPMVAGASDSHRRIRGMDRRALRRLGCDAGIVLVATDPHGSPVDVGRRQRRTSAALRRALHRRDKACSFPGCGATRHLHAHHVEHWADGGPTDLANLVLICGFHHRFVHDQHWTVEVRRDGHHRYRRPEAGRPVERVGWLPGASAEAVTRASPPTASAEALLPPLHRGGPFDLDMVVAVLQQEHERTRQPTAVAA